MFLTNVLVLLTLSAHPSSISDSLLHHKYTITLPDQPIHTQKERWSEGVFCIYSFNDGASIILTEGSLMEFSFQSYSFSKEIHNSGILDRKFRRHRSLNNVIEVYYYNVGRKSKRKYNRILRSVKVIE